MELMILLFFNSSITELNTLFSARFLPEPRHKRGDNEMMI